MRITLLLLMLVSSKLILAQQDQRITTIDFVQVLNGNKAETLYYYENNWKVLRIEAIKKDYIHSFELLETEPSEEQPFSFMLVTTYANKAQYDLREDNFGNIIEQNSETKYLNEKKKAEFRKILFTKDQVGHHK